MYSWVASNGSIHTIISFVGTRVSWAKLSTGFHVDIGGPISWGSILFSSCSSDTTYKKLSGFKLFHTVSLVNML